ncbi:uncharacterized protein LOC119639280 [Glossina fuscipes]|uniref:Uncharacterized protein LOC119639280 n=1 Tax=Glossina fuscipes TaxID=7396 RepID=A0A9C5YZP0_9MUSC|nr:uncharacterized protein LOC119639280 [Glossina fuscipes]
MKLICRLWQLYVMTIAVVNAGECALNTECVSIANCPSIRDNFNTIEAIPYCDLDRRGTNVCCLKLPQNYTKPKDVDLPIVRECRSYSSLPRTCYKPYVVGGTIAEPKELPFMALLYRKEADEFNQICGGTLISKRYVLSAAHCFFDGASPPNWVRLGELNYTSTADDALPQDIEIINFIPHHKYHTTEVQTKYNDIALVKLAKEAVFNDYVSPACLPIVDGNEFYEFVAAGWGSASSNTKSSSHLFKVKLERFDDEKCFQMIERNEKLREGGVDNRTQICAGSFTSNQGTCSGDSGGPLFVYHPEFRCQFLVVGVTSFGEGNCGTRGVPDVYTKVQLYTDWIQSIMISSIMKLIWLCSMIIPVVNGTYAKRERKSSAEIESAYVYCFKTNECALSTECKSIAKCPSIRDNFDSTEAKPYCNLDRRGTNVCCVKPLETYAQPKDNDLRIVRECKAYDNLPRTCYKSLIVGGVEAKPKEFPFMALLYRKEVDVLNQICGGTLISKKYVLTAAHCFFDTNSPPDWVRLGELNYTSNDDDAMLQDIEIRNFIPHHQYHTTKLETKYNDIALVKLARDAVFNDYVSPACLPLVDGNDFQEFLAAGWGSTSYNTKSSTHLFKVKLERFDDEKCFQLIERSTELEKGVDSRTQICAGSSTGNHGTCSGDSGGPLFVNHPEFRCQFLVVGVTSFGEGGCGNKGFPEVYTRVKLYIDWIESIVWD